MTRKFNFISDLDDLKAKRRFQVYEVTMGFEKADVAIPLEKVAMFEKAIDAAQPNSATSLKKLTESLGGEMIE